MYKADLVLRLSICRGFRAQRRRGGNAGDPILETRCGHAFPHTCYADCFLMLLKASGFVRLYFRDVRQLGKSVPSELG